MTDEQCLRRAYELASMSKDPSSQNGAILMNPPINGLIQMPGYNHFYDGVPENYDDRTKKLQGIEHAERDAIFVAAKKGFCTHGATLYCPWVACRDCARAILGVGIDTVVCHQQRMALTNDRWQADIDEALGWLRSAGVGVDFYDGPVFGGPVIRVSGRHWCPERLDYVEGPAHVGG